MQRLTIPNNVASNVTDPAAAFALSETGTGAFALSETGKASGADCFTSVAMRTMRKLEANGHGNCVCNGGDCFTVVEA